MIRLGCPKEARRLSLPHGVVVTVRPLTTAVYFAARETGRRLAVQAAIERGLIESAGGTVLDFPDGTDADAIAGLSQMFFTQALAIHAITAWEGVRLEDGQTAPVTEATVKQLIGEVPGLADAFLAHYTQPIAAMVAEGEGCGVAPNGTSAAAPATARGAATPTNLAPTD